MVALSETGCLYSNSTKHRPTFFVHKQKRLDHIEASFAVNRS